MKWIEDIFLFDCLDCELGNCDKKTTTLNIELQTDRKWFNNNRAAWNCVLVISLLRLCCPVQQDTGLHRGKEAFEMVEDVGGACCTVVC